jgi:chromosome segregation ATPase
MRECDELQRELARTREELMRTKKGQTEELTRTREELMRTREKLMRTREELTRTEGELLRTFPYPTDELTRNNAQPSRADEERRKGGREERKIGPGQISPFPPQRYERRSKNESVSVEPDPTKDELTRTKEELTRTKEELARTKAELARFKDELARSKDELARSKDELARASGWVARAKDELAHVNAAQQRVASENTWLRAELDRASVALEKKREVDVLSSSQGDSAGWDALLRPRGSSLYGMSIKLKFSLKKGKK